MLRRFKGGLQAPPTHSSVGEKEGTPCGSRTWGVVGFPKKHSWRPGGAVPHGARARCLPPALVAWGAAVPTLTSPGTMLTAAALLVPW